LKSAPYGVAGLRVTGKYRKLDQRPRSTAAAWPQLHCRPVHWEDKMTPKLSRACLTLAALLGGLVLVNPVSAQSPPGFSPLDKTKPAAARAPCSWVHG
jgi:hypothetical protein